MTTIHDNLNIIFDLMDKLSNIFILTDANGDIKYVNSKFLDYTGFTLEELIGYNTRIFKSGNLSKKHYKNLWCTISSGQSWTGEFTNRSKSGKIYYIKCTISPIKNSEGIISYYIAISEDLTEVKKHTNFLKLLNHISTSMINASSEQIDNKINNHLSEIGRFFNVDRCYIFLYKDYKLMDNTHEWCSTNINPFYERLQNLKLNDFNIIINKLNKLEHIFIKDVNELEKDAIFLKNTLIEEGVKSCLLVPLIFQKTTIGFIGYDYVQKFSTCTNSLVADLKLVSEIFSNAIMRKRNELEHLRKIQILSSIIAATNSAEDLDILCAKITNSTLQLMNFDFGIIYLKDSSTNIANLIYICFTNKSSYSIFTKYINYK